jgi:hypothetical protein
VSAKTSRMSNLVAGRESPPLRMIQCAVSSKRTSTSFHSPLACVWNELQYRVAPFPPTIITSLSGPNAVPLPVYILENLRVPPYDVNYLVKCVSLIIYKSQGLINILINYLQYLYKSYPISFQTGRKGPEQSRRRWKTESSFISVPGELTIRIFIIHYRVSSKTKDC